MTIIQNHRYLEPVRQLAHAHLRDRTLTLSATDLARHLGCEYLTRLNRQAAEGNLKKPVWPDPVLEALRERGKRHEAEYLAHLEAQGQTVVNLDGSRDQGQVADLMRHGVDVIAQARLAGDGFMGYADFLIKVQALSDLGDFSYEVTDTKLASQTKAGTILQLSLYSQLVGEIQGRTPDRMHVVRPGVEFRPETFRVEEYGAYYRLVRRWLLDAVASPDDTLYPLPCAECAVCDWQGECRARWRADDHLTLVAGMTVQQGAEFERQGITTLEQLGSTPGPLKERPVRGALATYERLREQARVQLEGRKTDRLIRYTYPPQDTAIDSKTRVYEVGNWEEDLGEVVAHDIKSRMIDIKKRGRSVDRHPAAIMPDDRVPNGVKAQSLLAFARSVAEHGLDGDGPFRAAVTCGGRGRTRGPAGSQGRRRGSPRRG